MTRSLSITLTLLALLLALSAQLPVRSAAAPADADPVEDFVIATSTSQVKNRIIIEISVRDRLDVVVNYTTVEGKMDAVISTRCTPPADASLSLQQSFCDAVEKAKDWIRRNLARVQVSAPSAYVMEIPSLQSRKLATVRRGDSLQKVGEQDLWVKVTLNKQMGWILAKFVQPAQ